MSGPAAALAEGPTEAAANRGTLIQRLRVRLIAAASWLACRLPEGPLVELAELAGEAAYRLAPARRARARRNLRRVCEWLAAANLGPARARAAATDPRALERLVRSAFRHHARYYLEVARTPSLDERFVRERLVVETVATVDAAFAADPPAIFVGLHFGALELPAILFVKYAGRYAVVPMETIGDAPLQRWFTRTRGSVGIRIVGLLEARRELTAALRSGHPVGLVADRDLTGGGIEVELFGAPARLPVGPALLAVETGSPVYVAVVRRDGRRRYRGRLDPVPVPAGGTRRARVEAVLAAEARAFERAIADAPDQWWAVFFPIWPDLEREAGR